MKTKHSSLKSFLLPWLTPFVVKFVVVDGGIEVQLYKKDHIKEDWQASQLSRVLPEPLVQWIDDHHIADGPQPYPVAKALWQGLAPLISKKLVINASELEALEEVAQPQDFALIWTLNTSLERIEGKCEGIDRYLGMGWFQKGTKIWSLKNNPSQDTYALFDNLTMPIQQADTLLHSVIPSLQEYLPMRADFQLITDFAPQVNVLDIRSQELKLEVQCNYPQLRSTILQPQQGDALLAQQTVIHFPRQLVTSILLHLLRSNAPVTLRGMAIPIFIVENLPVMRRHHQISEDLVAKIKQTHPIVSIAMLQPTLSLSHRYGENGIGKYFITGSYHYQQKSLQMDAFLSAYQQNQRFVQQDGVWFEWPQPSQNLFTTIKGQLEAKEIRWEEVMGFGTQRITRTDLQPDARTIRPLGTIPTERGHSALEQLHHHGIPGGIVGESSLVIPVFIKACEKLLQANRQARILWLTSSRQKGAVTRALRTSTVSSYITAASLITLRDQPALLLRAWTLVIFQDVEQLHDGSAQARQLFSLKWGWALISVTSKHVVKPSMMQILHLPEQHHKQFCELYLFDPQHDNSNTTLNKNAVVQNTTAPSVSPKATPGGASQRRTIELNQKKIAEIHQSSEQIQKNLTVKNQGPSHIAFTKTSVSSAEVPAPSKPAAHQEIRQTNTQAQIAYQQSTEVSNRIAVLRLYWLYLDGIHARQKAGMKPLWGLVEDYAHFNFTPRSQNQTPYQAQIYKKLLPTHLLTEIDQLWGTKLLARWPERIVSEPFPHKQLADTFGVALEFWHGCALTVWFNTEGPSSRAALSELTVYYQKKIQMLKDMGTPVDERLFEELKRADANLPQPQPFMKEITGRQGNIPGSIMASGRRREGFEKLRDIVSSYRRQWAERYLDYYLQQRFHTEMGEVIHVYQLISKPERTPTATKRFITDAEMATNHWFGGDISKLYGAIQQPSPIEPRRVAILPLDSAKFVSAVYEALNTTNGRAMPRPGAGTIQQFPGTGKFAGATYYNLNKLANLSSWYVQLEEARGSVPTLKDFGTSKFTKWSTTLNDNVDKAWDIFAQAIEAAKREVTPLPGRNTFNQPLTENIKNVFGTAVKPEVQSRPASPTNVPPAAEAPFKVQPEPKVATKTPAPTGVQPEPGSATKAPSSAGVQPEPGSATKAPSSAGAQPEPGSATKAPSSAGAQPEVSLDMEAIARLQEESKRLQERLTIEAEEEERGSTQPQLETVTIPPAVNESDAAIGVDKGNASISEVDEEWQLIVSQWKTEHWEILALLYQGQSAELATAVRKYHRPLSQFIDEINAPVDEQLSDLLIDPEDNTIFEHLHGTAESLVRWYLSSKGR
ncbi:hypothetical protein ccbrp13_62380 [Ktedonobacteria bacterium brp13]|nr:hypothetical protein ccbrp13_62380 [Ktedonobacteria bacterium brp13]